MDMEKEVKEVIMGTDYYIDTEFRTFCVIRPQFYDVSFCTFNHFGWVNWILRILSREQVASLDPTGRWSSLRYLVLLEKFNAGEMARKVPYSLEAVLFMISMKLKNPARSIGLLLCI